MVTRSRYHLTIGLCLKLGVNTSEETCDLEMSMRSRRRDWNRGWLFSRVLHPRLLSMTQRDAEVETRKSINHLLFYGECKSTVPVRITVSFKGPSVTLILQIPGASGISTIIRPMLDGSIWTKSGRILIRILWWILVETRKIYRCDIVCSLWRIVAKRKKEGWRMCYDAVMIQGPIIYRSDLQLSSKLLNCQSSLYLYLYL